MYKKSLLILFVLLVLPVSGAFASGGETVHPPSQSWSFDGPFGTFDRAAMQRGLKVYREVCSACHSLKRVAFRNLTDRSFDENSTVLRFSQSPTPEGAVFASRLIYKTPS